MQPEGWVKVYESPMMHQAMMVQDLLKEKDIVSVMLNQQDSAYVLLGEVSLYVSLQDAPAAFSLIEDSFPD